MPARGVGYYGTLVERRARMVRSGGRVRYYGDWYQSDSLIPYVGQRVMFDYGIGCLDGNYPVYECWMQQVSDARWMDLTGRKRRHRTVEGKFLGHAHKEVS